jgi:hypothetical protein
MSRLLPVLFAILFLAACSGSGQAFNRGTLDYIRKNDLSAKDSVHVINGRIYRGMPVEHAIASLGEPNERDTSSWDGGTQLKLMYRSRPNAFDPGNIHEAYVYAANGAVTRWENLEKIPRFDAYYEGSL